ncbi:MAG: GNAT family N-acetyltransferase [Spirochaetales bacterium]|nr:GNAT family N-acetyltransferase [Spirochaetales bacterium]
MFQLRPFQQSDTESCRKLILSCVRYMSGMEAQAYPQIEEKERQFPLDRELALCYAVVATKDEEIVALGALDKNIVKRLCVSPRHHRVGLGRQVMEDLENHARNEGIKRLRLDSPTNAVRFFLKIGYSEQYPKIWQLGGAKIHNMVMGKDLL